MVNKIIVSKILSDEEVNKLEGHWIDESYIKKKVINNNTDVYYYEDKNKTKLKLLLKFRKNVIPQKYREIGFESFKDAAIPSRGRAASAGPVDYKGQYWSKRKPIKGSAKNSWSVRYLQNGKPSKMVVNNPVASSVVGYYERTPFLKKPCRLTHFPRAHWDLYKQGVPFIEQIDKLYKKLTPKHYIKQYNRVSSNPGYRIGKTAFTTVTVNRNFRTALHIDDGDYKEGFGNLTILERGKYQGGYTVFPQFGIGVDVRSGDFLSMDVHQWHSNTPLYETESDKKYNDKLEDIFQDNPEVGIAGIYKKYTRLSFVCYAREKIDECPKVSSLNKNGPELQFLTPDNLSKKNKITKKNIPKKIKTRQSKKKN